MTFSVIDSARHSFERQGYAMLPIFQPDLVRAAQADISAHIDRLSEALYLPAEAGRPDLDLDERIDRIWESDRSHAALLRQAICTDAHRGPRLQALANEPALRTAAEQLCGHRLEASSVMRVRASISCFPQQRHAWHSDVARDDGTRCGKVLITAWIPLSDAGPQSGGLEIATGRQSGPLAQIENHGFHIPDQALNHLPKVQPECPAGHVLFLDRFTPHRTLPTVKARFALVIWMIGA